MKKMAISVLLAAGLTVCGAVGMAQTGPNATGQWHGKVQVPDRELGLTVHLAKSPNGVWIGSMTVSGSTAVDVPLGEIKVEGTAVTFTASLPKPTSFDGHFSVDASSLSGTVSNADGEASFQLTRNGEADVKVPPPSSPLSQEFDGAWEGIFDLGGKARRIELKLLPAADGLASATFIDQGNLEIPITTVTIKGKELQLEARSVSGTYRGTLGESGKIAGEWSQGSNRLPLTLTRMTTTTTDNLLDRWANAVGGREKVATIKAIYREATIKVGDFQGTIKVWHTADGKYRKEEQVATYARIETFDGVNGTVQQGAAPPQKMADAELELTRSKRFANSNAIFFVFFPERHRGSVAVEGTDTIVFKPEGGIEWRVSLDPETSLPKTMVHREGARTITVTFGSYETVDGLRVEKDIQRSAGDPRFGTVIQFTRTLINPPVDASLFSIRAEEGGAK